MVGACGLRNCRELRNEFGREAFYQNSWIRSLKARAPNIHRRWTLHPSRPQFCRAAIAGLFVSVFAASCPLQAAITSVNPNSPTIAKYAKLELSVALTDKYKNPYDPDEADMSAEFTSPAGKLWKVNGFFDGAGWKVRFAANEIGDWHYTVSIKDATGTAKSTPQTFSCKIPPPTAGSKSPPTNATSPTTTAPPSTASAVATPGPSPRKISTR